MRYNLDKNGVVNGFGINPKFKYEYTSEPFNSENFFNFRFENNEWIEFDASWTYPEFAIRVTIPQTVILDSDFYSALVAQVKELISLGFAQQEVIGEDRVMYFNQLQPEHIEFMESDINVKIEEQ